MTLTFTTALALLALCPLALRVRYGRQWLMRPFALLVLAGVVYHGVAEVIIRATGADDLVVFRPTLDDADMGAVVGATALLAMTVGYLATSSQRAPVDTGVDRQALTRAFDWRLCLAALVPLTAATVAGEGYNTGENLAGQGLGVTGLAYQFFVIVTVLTAFSILLRRPQLFVPVIAGQSLLLAVAGQRLEILVAAGTLWLLAARVGMTPNRRQTVGTLTVALLLLAAIGSVRASAGRDLFYTDNGFQARLTALKDGVLNPQADAVNGGDVLAEAGLRLDSNNWSGQVYSRFDAGADPLGPAAVRNTAVAAIPSALFPSKVTSLSIYDRSPELDAIVRLGLPNIDYLPGHATFFYPALGWPWLLLFNVGAGALFGLADRLALRRVNVAGIVALGMLTQAALFFERGWPYYFIQGRSFLILVAVLAMWAWARRLLSTGRPEPAQVRRREPSGLRSRADGRPTRG